MKRSSQIVFLGCAVLSLVAALPIWADDQRVESAEMLARASKLEQLQSVPATPFVMQAEIKAALDKKEVPGSYKLAWWSPNRWQEAEALGDFRRSRDGASDGYWQIRPWDYQPRVIFDLDELLDVAAMLKVGPRETIGKVRRRKIAGIELACVEIDYERAIDKELCFDPATGMLLHAERAERAESRSNRTIFDYSEAISLSGNKFPSRLRIQRGKGFSMEVSIGHLELVSSAPPPAPVAGSEHFEFWRFCQDVVPAVLEKTVQPQFPEALRRTHGQGTVSLYVRIEPDGTISHMKTLQAASPILERAAREAVEQWRYKPPSCQGAAVKAETIIDVVFSSPQ